MLHKRFAHTCSNASGNKEFVFRVLVSTDALGFTGAMETPPLPDSLVAGGRRFMAWGRLNATLVAACPAAGLAAGAAANYTR